MILALAATGKPLVEQDDGSWLLEGLLGERPVRLPREAMLVVAEAVLRRTRQQK